MFDFESEAAFDQFHWQCHTLFSLSEKHAARGKRSLKLELFPSSYPGLSPKLGYNDWRGHEFFCFNVHNPGKQTIRLVLRIDDKKDSNDHGDRYNKSLVIVPGDNEIKIPVNTLKTSSNKRFLALDNIYRFLLFMSHPDKKHVLYLDNFRLIPKA